MSLSANIRNFRVKRGLTQEALADLLGVSAQAVSKWETSETYPDGSLLLPLAKALQTSLDRLFDHDGVTMEDLSGRVIRMLSQTPEENQMELARDICWQIEKGLCGFASDDSECYDPEEYRLEKYNRCTSYVRSAAGFTQYSGRNAPIFALFPEPKEGYGAAIGDGGEARDIFGRLSAPDTLRAALFIHQKNSDYLFEADLLAEECAIGPDRIGAVMDDLVWLKLVRKQRTQLDGKRQTLYLATPSRILIALLLFAGELRYDDAYTTMSDRRNKPYLTE